MAFDFFRWQQPQPLLGGGEYAAELAPFFDPEELQRRKVNNWLVAAGSALMGGGPQPVGSSFLGNVGKAMKAGHEAMQDAEKDYYQTGLQGFQLGEAVRKKKQEEADAEDARKQREYFMTNVVPTMPPDMQNIARAYPDEAVKTWMKWQDPAYKTEQNIKSLQQKKLQLEIDKASKGGDSKYGFQTRYGVDAEGNPVMVQVNDRAEGAVTKLPPGVKLSKDPIKLDAGTHFVLLDPITRQPVGTIPKEIAEAEKQKEIGQQEGKMAAAAQGDLAAAESALALVNDLRNDPNRAMGTGASSVLNFIPATPGYDYQNKVNQATSGAFLTAIQQMRGLGQLSNIEGQTATQAITRMNTATSEKAFLDALQDYENVILKARERALSRIKDKAASGPVEIDGFKISPVP